MKTRNKLMVSVFALIATIILATSTTFAWFTMNDKVSVGDIDVSATTGTDGLYIAMGDKTDGTWKPSADGFGVSLTKAQMLAGIKTGFNTVEGHTYGETTNTVGMKTVTYFDAAAVADASKPATVTEVGFYSYDNIAKTYTKVTAPNFVVKTDERFEYEYLEFSLFFKSTVPMDIAFLSETVDGGKKSTITSTSKNPNTASDITAYNVPVFTAYKSDGTAAPVKDAKVPMDSANAARVGFGEVATMKIWNPNAGKGYDKIVMADVPESTTGGSEAPAIKKDTTLTCAYIDHILAKAPGTTTLPTFFNKKDAADNARVGKTGTCAIDASAVEVVTSIANITAANKLVATTAVNGLQTELKVSMWIEGWDGDCSNSLFSEVFTTVMHFAGKATV